METQTRADHDFGTARLSLDGTWDIVFDPGNAGRANRWHLADAFDRHPYLRQIGVPSCWELAERDYEGVAYYRRVFALPASWEGKTVRMRFGAVNYRAEVWVNDTPVGVNEGGFTPFELCVESFLRPGEENTVVVRVLGPIAFSGQIIDGIGPLETPQWRGGITGGIWQSVELIASGPAYIEDAFISAQLSGEVSLEVNLTQAAMTPSDAELVVEILEAESGQAVASVRKACRLQPGRKQDTIELGIDRPRFWSPDDPFLYRASIRLIVDGEVLDVWSHRFGVRELTLRDNRFVLNDKPCYVKACFFEGVYPNGIAVPDSVEMAREELRLAKEAGFNTIRPWRKPPMPWWLDLCDEMGLMAVGSLAIECMGFPKATPALPARIEHEVRSSVLRDRNHACIVQWELFNELHQPALMALLQPMAQLARELDPTRLILDESGGWAYGANLYLPSEHTPTPFNDIHTYSGPFVNRHHYDGYVGIGLSDEQAEAQGLDPWPHGKNVKPGLLSFVSELGYGSLPDLFENNRRFEREGHPLTPSMRNYRDLARWVREALDASGFGGDYPDLRDFCLEQQAIHGQANRRIIEATRANGNIVGYCVHALTSGNWIVGAGLLDLWRQPKTDVYTQTRDANQPRVLAARLMPRNVYASRGTTLRVVAVNELEPAGGKLRVKVSDAEGRIVWSDERAIDGRTGVADPEDFTLETAAWSGAFRVDVRWFDLSGIEIATTQETFDVFNEAAVAPPQAEVACFDLGGELTSFLDRSAIEAVPFTAKTAHGTPVLVAGIGDGDGVDSARIAELEHFIREGGTAIYLEGGGSVTGFYHPKAVAPPTLPVKATLRAGFGLWWGVSHLTRPHPILAGLPTGGSMRETFENVYAQATLTGLDAAAETVVAAVTYTYVRPEMEHTSRQHFMGMSEAFWGADLALIPLGKGRCIASQLRIINNLGKDPVAEVLLWNMVRFAVGVEAGSNSGAFE